MGWSRVGVVAVALAAACVLLVYLDRVFLDLPLYGIDEGAYILRALYGKAFAANPQLAPGLQQVNNTIFLLVIRAVTYGTHNLLEWMRILGGVAYFGGLLLVYRGVRGNLDRGQALGFLLLALAFPYYRFAFAVMPEGWYVGLLGLIVLVTARLYLPRPMVHALLAGALTGALTLTKPNGIAVAAAFPVLAILDLALGRRDLKVFAARIVLFAAAFLAAGNLITLAAGQPITQPFTFFLAGHYAHTLANPSDHDSLILAVKTSALLVAASLILAGIPALTGLMRIEMRWRWSNGRERFSLEPQEVSFLLVLLSFAATLAMVTIFAVKAVGNNPSEANRLWGRYFEFFVPMLWLTAAPFIVEFERGGGRWWRIVMGLVPAAGAAGLAACLFGGVMLYPWDATALTAFLRTDLVKLNVPLAIPLFACAMVATAAACAASAFTTWRTHRIWFVYIVALGLLSTWLDLNWERAARPGRAELNAELHAAKELLDHRQGQVAVVVDDVNIHHMIAWRLKARAFMIMSAPDEPIDAARLLPYDTLVVSGRHRIGGDWKPVFEGEQLKVLERAPPPPVPLPSPTRGGEALGSEARSG